MAKITTLEQALKVIKALRADNTAKDEQIEQLKKSRGGIRSSGVVDRYTDMAAADLRGLVIKRGGDPDEVAHGFHSRGRSIAMREWLRAHPAKKGEVAIAKPVKKQREAATAPKKASNKPSAKKPAKPEPKKKPGKRRTM